MEILGKKILITGAAKRVGRAIALHLAGLGAELILHYHRSVREAQTLVKQCERLGAVRPCLLRADLNRPAQVLRLADQAWKQGPIDVLINNASAFYPTPPGSIRPQDAEELYRINTLAPMLLMDRLGTRMKRRKRGLILNIADYNYLRPAPAYLAYGASKAALVALNQAYARALAPGVRVNAILPGTVLWPEDFPQASKKKVLKKSLLKKNGKPDDVSRAVEYLLRDGEYCTGTLLNIDGGASLA